MADLNNTISEAQQEDATKNMAQEQRLIYDRLSSLKKKTEALHNLCDVQMQKLAQTQKILTDTRQELDTDIKSDRSKAGKFELIKKHISSRQSTVQKRRKVGEELLDELKQRHRRMLNELWDIFRITEFPDGRGYSICDIHLPSTEHLDGHDETMISVAVGYVGHLLSLLSDTLDVSLRFPLKYYGSKSMIYCNRKNQLFPLYTESFKSRDVINFTYGMTLLNLNILQLRTLVGMTTCEPEDTLANLHGLKMFLTGEEYRISTTTTTSAAS